MRDSIQPTEIRVTERYLNPRTGRYETWSAVSADGRFTYNRSDETGTPWIVKDTSTGTEVGQWFRSLDRARRHTSQLA